MKAINKRKFNYGKFLTAVLLFAVTIMISACTQLFFQPNQINYLVDIEVPFPIEEVGTTTADGQQLTHWLLKPEKPLGIVFFLHGNAQNISAHIRSVAWLVKPGYFVYMFEYRGYITKLKPSLEKTISDVQLALDEVIEKYPELPIYVFGQSLGGSIAIASISQFKEKEKLCALITEAAFTSYSDIAKEKFDEIWFPQWMTVPLSRLFNSDYDAKVHIANIAPLPILVMHSSDDKIVPIQHGESLFKAAIPPKSFIRSEGIHISSLGKPLYRTKFLQFIQEHQCKPLISRNAVSISHVEKKP